MGSSFLCSLLIALCLNAVSFGKEINSLEHFRQQQQNLRQHNDKATSKQITVVPNIPFARIPSDQIEITYIHPATDSNLGPIERMLSNTDPDSSWMPVLANSYEVELHVKDETKVVNFIGISSDYRYAPIRYWQLRVGQSTELQTFQIPYVFSFQPILQPIQNSQGGGVFLLRFDFDRPTEVPPTLIEISLYSGDTTPPSAMCVTGWRPIGAESSQPCSFLIPSDESGYCGCAWSDYYIVPTLGQYAMDNPSHSLAHTKDCETLCNAFNNNNIVGYTFEPIPPNPVCRFPCKTCDKINWSQCGSCELGYRFHPDTHTCTAPTDLYNMELMACGGGEWSESLPRPHFNYFHPPAFDLTEAGLVWFMINWPDDPWTGTFRVRISLQDYSNNTNFFAIDFDNQLTTAWFCYDESNCNQGFSDDSVNQDNYATANNNGRIWISLKDGALSFGYGVYSFGAGFSQPLIAPRNRLTFLQEGQTELPSFSGMRPHVGFCASSPTNPNKPMKLMNARIALPTLALDYVFNECAGTYSGDEIAYADEWPALLTPVVVPQQASMYFKLSENAGQSFRFTWTSGDAITQNDALLSFSRVAVYWTPFNITVSECQSDVCQPDQTVQFNVPSNSGRWFKANGIHLSFGFRLPGEPSVAGDDQSADFTLVNGDAGYQNLALFCNGYDTPLPQFEYIALSSPCGVPPTPEYGSSDCADIHSDQQWCEQQCNWGVLEGDLNRTCVYGHWSQLVCNEPPPFCDPISAPDFGEDGCPQTLNGGNCTQHCLQGVASGSETRNCTDGAWSALTCKAPDCPAMGDPQYGSGPCKQTPNGMDCDQMCTFAIATGSTIRKCKNGVWSSLECAPYCPILDGVENGEGECANTAVGKTCPQTCTYGVLSGSAVRTCNADQTWTDLVCNDPPIPCPAMEAPNLGSGECPTSNLGDHCVQACHYSVASGSVNRTCGVKGEWSPLVCDVQKCGALGPPQFGGGNCGVSLNNSLCTQSCINGAKSGSTTRVCLNGQWSPLTCNLLYNCPALGEPLHGEGECPETASGSYCNQTCVVDVQLGNPRRLCTNGVWSPLACNGTFVPVLLFEWGESILSRFDDVFAQPVPKLYPQYVFICRTTGVKLGYVWGNNSYTLDSEFCTAAAHVTGLRGGVFDVHFTVDVLLPPDQRSPYPAVARNDVMSMFWGGKYPITYQIDRVHQGPTPAVNTPPSHHGYLLLEEEETRRNAGGTPVNTVVLEEVHRVQSTKSVTPQPQSQTQSQSQHQSQSVLSPPRRFAENYRKQQARGTLAPW